MEKKISEMLTGRTNELADAIEREVNSYERETGVSVNSIRVFWSEDDCQKHIRILCDYFNFESAMVRGNGE